MPSDDRADRLDDAPHSPDESTQSAATKDGPAAATLAKDNDGPRRLVSPEQQQTVISKERPEGSGSSAEPRSASPLEMAVALEGQRLGHFELGSFVGGGGMGAVFRATDTMLDRTVAVKILSRNRSDEEITRRFKNEAQSAARLDHPNIARVYYVGEDQGWNYIVFEFIEGVNIRDLVESKGPLSLEEAISYTLQIAEALEHAYSRDVVHRDIKPSNVLIMPDGRAKLVDMGLARLHQVESAEDDLTASGVTLGTFDYISPEQARDPRSADVRSDIYSLGCTLFYMLTGRTPFPGTAIQKLLSHTGDAPPDVREIRAELPEEVSTVVNRTMAKLPQDRYQQPSELIGELLLLVDQLGLVGATRGGTVWITREPSSSDRSVAVVVAVASLVLLIVGAFALDWYMARSDAPAESFPHVQLASPPEPVADAPRPNTPVPPVSPAPSEIKSPNPFVELQPGERSGDPATPPIQPEDIATDVAPASPVAPPSDTTANNTIAEVVSAATDETQLTPPATSAELDAAEDSQPGRIDSFDGVVAQLSADQEFSGPSAPSVVAPSEPELLIVGTFIGEVPPTARVVSSLDQALREAAKTPTVTRIELAGGLHPLAPIKIDLPELTISALIGARPIILFRPEADEFEILEKRMIQVVGGKNILWERIHFHVELPDDARDRWSLFHLQHVHQLELSHCTLTIQNASTDRRPIHQNVAFFEVGVPAMQDGEKVSLPPLFLKLQDCIARGEATLVRSETVTPFSIEWRQGLFVSTERLVEASGTADQPEDTARVEIDLANLTAFVKNGLCLLESTEDKPYQLQLDVDVANSIVVASDVPLIERNGATDIEQALKRMDIKDRENFYPYTSTYCRIGSDLSLSQIYSLRDFADLNPNVMLPKTDVMWNAGPDLSQAAHAYAPGDFQLDRMANPARGKGAGFDLSKLPTLPTADELLEPMPPAPEFEEADSDAE